MNKLSIPLLSSILLASSFLLSSPASAEAEAGMAKGAMVMFLTQTDQNVAGHALHIASRMHAEGRKTTVVLIGDAGRLAVKGARTKLSAVSGKPLQEALASFVKDGGRAFITPPTLALLNASPDDLLDGVTLPIDHAGLHDHMFEAGTKLVVF